MPFGTTLLFDAQTEARIRGAWTALAEAGVSRSMLMPGFRPHLSLSVGTALDVDRLGERLGPIAAEAEPFPVGLPGLGLFCDTGSVYLGVTPSVALLEFHRQIDSCHEEAAATLDEWYRPDGWVPHVTLAFGLDAAGLADAVRILAEPPLKLTGRAEVLAVVEGDESGWTEHRAFRLGTPTTG